MHGRILLAALAALAATAVSAAQDDSILAIPQPECAPEPEVFVLPTFSESCSMAVLEAIGAGLPVVASRVGGTPELVRAEQNGLLFEVGDAPGLAGALRRLCTEPGLHARLSAGSQRLAQNEFSWSSVAARYETLFAAAIREAP